MSDRRGFLRGLASLPFIGGSVALIGSPTQAAVPMSEALLLRYVAFTAHEHRAALTQWCLREPLGPRAEASVRDGNLPYLWYPKDPAVQAIVEGAEPLTRAAVILSAAGVPLVEGGI